MLHQRRLQDVQEGILPGCPQALPAVQRAKLRGLRRHRRLRCMQEGAAGTAHDAAWQPAEDEHSALSSSIKGGEAKCHCTCRPDAPQAASASPPLSRATISMPMEAAPPAPCPAAPSAHPPLEIPARSARRAGTPQLTPRAPAPTAPSPTASSALARVPTPPPLVLW